MHKFNIDFMGNRRIMFGISIVLIVISIGALAFRGLKFGVEFEGGTAIDIAKAGNVTSAQITDAFKNAGMANLVVQEKHPVNGERGFLIRSSETSPSVASAAADKAIASVGLPGNGHQVTTIGPDWGKNITSSALVALAVSIAAILLYVSLRFEYKMSVTAVLALVHDILITLGLYALIGWEVTPNVVAALLAILGYSLYDTIVVFTASRRTHRAW